MSVPRIRSIKGNLTNLLSITDYKSVNALMKAQPKLKTRKQAEQYLLDNWNEFADIMEENDKQEKEIPAEIAGFRRIVKLRNEPVEKVIRDWFYRHKSTHELPNEDIEELVVFLSDKYRDFYG